MRQARPKLEGSREERGLFLNLSGERISRQGFWGIVKHYQKQAGLEGNICPQSLRCACRQKAD